MPTAAEVSGPPLVVLGVLPWWSRECSLACAALCSCHWRDCKHHSMVLQMTIRNAKRDWVDQLLDDPDVSIWDLAKWRKGRRLKDIPPILADGSLTHDPDLMSVVFQSRFFDFVCETSPSPDLIHSQFLPTRPLMPIQEDEIRNVLCSTSTSSALGPSGINYLLVQWAFETSPGVFLSIFNKALSLGKHP
jgi:hypothetical protein